MHGTHVARAVMLAMGMGVVAAPALAADEVRIVVSGRADQGGCDLAFRLSNGGSVPVRYVLAEIDAVDTTTGAIVQTSQRAFGFWDVEPAGTGAFTRTILVPGVPCARVHARVALRGCVGRGGRCVPVVIGQEGLAGIERQHNAPPGRL